MARVARRRIVSATGYGDLISSFVLVVPLLLAYDLGVLLSSTINGADFITRGMLALCGHQRLPYLVMHASIAIVFLMWLYRSGRQRTWSIDVALPMIVEAAVYALTLGAAVSLVVHNVLGLGVRATHGVIQAVVAALGAGVHEELVFRLGLFAGGAALLRHLGASPRLAWICALIISSLAFAAAHHLGIYGEAWSLDVVAFRTLAGIAFAAIFWYRSFAHAVYAHVLYDLYVTLVAN